VEITREVVRRFNAHFGLNVEPSLFDEKNEEIFKRALLVIGSPIERRAEYRESTVKALRSKIMEEGYANFLEKVKGGKRFLKQTHVLHEPGHLLTETPRLPGTDGRRMAKSYGNAIWLSDAPDEIRAKVRNMMTDPQRQRRTDPGRPEICPVFAYHKLFSLPETIGKVERDCRSAAIGCVDCKKLIAENLVTWIEPVQERRKEFEANPTRVWDILDAGSSKARKAAKRTMRRVREAIFRWDEARK